MSEGMRERLVRLRDRLFEASCDLAFFYFAVEGLLKERVEVERRQQLFDRFMEILSEFQGIRVGLSQVIRELKEEKKA